MNWAPVGDRLERVNYDKIILHSDISNTFSTKSYTEITPAGPLSLFSCDKIAFRTNLACNWPTAFTVQHRIF